MTSGLADELRRIVADETAREPDQTWRAVSVNVLQRCADALDACAEQFDREHGDPVATALGIADVDDDDPLAARAYVVTDNPREG